MAEYIELGEAINLLCLFADESCASVVSDFENLLPADVVSAAAYRQVAWERDLALQQLRGDYGVGLGEKKADVAPVVHGRWVIVDDGVMIGDGKHMECSVCHTWKKDRIKTDYCPNCGARMDLEG